jgi:hypothetical protein
MQATQAGFSWYEVLVLFKITATHRVCDLDTSMGSAMEAVRFRASRGWRPNCIEYFMLSVECEIQMTKYGENFYSVQSTYNSDRSSFLPSSRSSCIFALTYIKSPLPYPPNGFGGPPPGPRCPAPGKPPGPPRGSEGPVGSYLAPGGT